MKTITVIVSPNGQTRVETQGFVGSECREASRFVEQALGQPSGEVLTAEFYAASTQQQWLREGQ